MLNDFSNYSLSKKSKNFWTNEEVVKERKRIDGAFYGGRTYVPVMNGVRRYDILQPIVTRSSPVQLQNTGDFWKAIDGESNSGWFMMLRYDNTLWGLGNNGNGELGQGDNFGAKNYLVQVPGIWDSFSCGENHVGAIADGNLYMWGYNGQGQLGHNNTSSKNSPVQVPGKWKRVFCGYRQTIALDSQDQLFMWGQNNHGQLGQQDYAYRSSPAQIGGKWSEVFCTSSTFTMATRKDRGGACFAWGRNNHGQLGLGDTRDRNSPCATIGAGWSQISLSDNHTLLLQRGDGDNQSRIWSIGYNNHGELGLIDRMPRSRAHLIQGGRSSPTGTLAYNPINTILLNRPKTEDEEFQNWHSVHAMNSWSAMIDHGGGLWWLGYNGSGLFPTTEYTRWSPNVINYSHSSPVFVCGKWAVYEDEPYQALYKRGSDHFLGLRRSFDKKEIQISDRI